MDRRLFLAGASLLPIGALVGRRAAGAAPTPQAMTSAPVEPQPAIAMAERLRPLIRGEVVARGEDYYEDWRQSMMWQLAKAPRKPSLIVQAENASDVAAAVRFASQNKLKVTTRAGGHSMSACFLRDGGMLIDVSRLNRIVSVDKPGRLAVVEPGVIGRGLVERLLQDGLSFPVAHCGMVPISGFLLGGGVGLNSNSWGGMSVFGIRGLDIVTADGVLRHATETENPDLFWAARGGGPGLFGVVTAFHLQCRDAAPTIHGATYTFPFAEFEAVAAAVDEIAARLHDSVELSTVVTMAPDDLKDRCGGDSAGRVVIVDAAIFVADKAEADRLVAPLAGHAIISRAIARDEGHVQSYDEYFSANEASFPQTHWMGDNVYVDDPKAAAKILRKHVPDSPTPGCTPLLLYKGTSPYPDAACSTRGRFYLSYYMEWSDPADEGACRAYSKAVFEELKTISNGSYINEMDQEGRRDDVPRCYSASAWKRLKQLRTEYDPNGVFHDFLGQA